MAIAETTGTGVDLKFFERQHLVCPNCGDRDSRFVFVSADVGRPSTALDKSPALTATGERFSPEHHDDELSQPMAPDLFLAVDTVSDVPSEQHPGAEHIVEPGVNEKATEPTSKFAELIQAYMAKWRQTPNP